MKFGSLVLAQLVDNIFPRLPSSDCVHVQVSETTLCVVVSNEICYKYYRNHCIATCHVCRTDIQ